MFGLPTDYEFEYRLADLKRTTTAAVLQAQAVSALRATRLDAGPTFRSRLAQAVPLKVSVRWEPRQRAVGGGCETAS